jgi:hypothetical protein
MSTCNDFIVRIPARLLKDGRLSSRARLLWSTLAAFADGRTDQTYVSHKAIEKLLRCGRVKRQEAESELIGAGWLRIEQVRNKGRFSRRTYTLLRTRNSTAVQKLDSGKKGRIHAVVDRSAKTELR